MPNVTLTEVAADQPITGIAAGISVAIVHADRGPVGTPILVTSWAQYVEWFGYYRTDSYASYSIRGFFNNGGRSLWVIRVVGDDSRNAGGANDDKVETSKAQLTKGAADGLLQIQSDTRGMDGTLINVTLEANTSDATTVTLANTYDITLKLASVSAWKKSAKVCATVLNGQAHLVTAGHAVPSATNSVVFYASTAGIAGNSLSVTVIDSGGGGLAASFNALNTKLTIDLGGATPTAAQVVAAVNVLAKSILAYAAGSGADVWNAVAAEAYLASGIATVPALVTGSYGGTGLTAMGAYTRSWLAGTGSVTAASDVFTDTTYLDGLTAVAAKVLPGDKLIVWNGANAGCYTIATVTAEDAFTVTENFGATQANIIYTIMGTDGAYGHVTADLVSPGVLGDSFSLRITKETGGATLKAVLSVTDTDNATRELEEFENLSPNSADSNFIETVIAAESEWFTLDTFPEYIKSNGTGSSTAGDPALTDATATFEDDEVEVGDFVVVSSATAAADVRVYEVTAIVSNTELTLDENFVGTQADVVYEVLGSDSTGAALLALVGTGLTITFGGGVDDIPNKDDYLGNSVAKTGVYAIDNIPVKSRPTKLWVPDAPIIVDSSGVDATDLINIAMGEYCAARQYLRYCFPNERGLSPAQTIIAAAADTIDNKWVAEYYNWGKMNDPVSGSLKLAPLHGHMVGQAVAMGAGAIGEGDHQAVANVVIADVVSLEYEVSDDEAELLNDNNINCIRNWNGIRNMGDRVRTSDAAWKWLHKRDVAIRMNQSILNSLKTWVNFVVNAVNTYGKISKVCDAYLRTEDRRFNPTGALENPTNPGAAPYYISCSIETPGNSLAKTKITAAIGYSIVNTVEDVEVRVGLWDGGAVLEEV